MHIEENVPLAPLTTFAIGGPARHFAQVQDIQEMREAFAFAKAHELPVFVLGGGSNLLVSDKGYDGLVIKIKLMGVEIQQDETNAVSVICIACAGEGWDALVERACREKYWGIENLSGIPGTVGGAVVQNIGAYGAALSEVLLWAEVFDTRDNKIKMFSAAECGFDYRDSVFKHTPELVVLRAAFKLSTAPKPNISYKDLAKLFSDSSLEIGAIREAVLAIRKGKFPDLGVEGTAGSFFKNPIVEPSQARALAKQYPGLPMFTMPETSGVKVPLAWFLDYKNGVIDMRQVKSGGARLYEKQPLVIAAKKGSSADDVKTLMREVQKQVKEKIHIEIEPEVKII